MQKKIRMICHYSFPAKTHIWHKDTELIIFMIMMEGLNIKLRQRNLQVRLSYWFIFYSHNFH